MVVRSETDFRPGLLPFPPSLSRSGSGAIWLNDGRGGCGFEMSPEPDTPGSSSAPVARFALGPVPRNQGAASVRARVPRPRF